MCRFRVYIVRESQGEKGPFYLGQGKAGKSGKLAMVRGKWHFHTLGQGKDFIFDHY